MKLNSKIVWDESFGQGSYSFYKQAKEIERQINKDECVIKMVLKVNTDLQTQMLKILEQDGNDNIGRAIDYTLRTIGRYNHKIYYAKGHKYMATIDLVLKKFILEPLEEE